MDVCAKVVFVEIPIVFGAAVIGDAGAAGVAEDAKVLPHAHHTAGFVVHPGVDRVVVEHKVVVAELEGFDLCVGRPMGHGMFDGGQIIFVDDFVGLDVKPPGEIVLLGDFFCGIKSFVGFDGEDGAVDLYGGPISLDDDEVIMRDGQAGGLLDAVDAFKCVVIAAANSEYEVVA